MTLCMQAVTTVFTLAPPIKRTMTIMGMNITFTGLSYPFIWHDPCTTTRLTLLHKKLFLSQSYYDARSSLAQYCLQGWTHVHTQT